MRWMNITEKVSDIIVEVWISDIIDEVWFISLFFPFENFQSSASTMLIAASIYGAKK